VSSLPKNWKEVYTFIYNIWYDANPTAIPTAFELVVPYPVDPVMLPTYTPEALDTFDSVYQELMEP